MKDKDLFKEVFSDKLKEHAVDVNPNLWNAVSSQIASSGAAAGGTALGIGAKVIIGVAVAASLGTAAFFITKEDTNSPTIIAQNKVENVVSEKEAPTQTKTTVVADETIDQVANEELEEVVSTIEPEIEEKPESTLGRSEDTPNTEENTGSTVNSAATRSTDNFKEDEPVRRNETRSLAEEHDEKTTENAEVDLSYTIVPTLKNGVYNFKIEGDDFETVEWNFGNEEYSLQKEANYFYKTPGRKTVKAIVVQGDVVKELETTVEVKIAGKFIEVPTAFTPNNDGSNDYYKVKTVDIAEFTVRIVDINQSLVYQSEEVDFTWDGIAMDGSLAPEGTYRIIIIGKDVNGYPVNYQGSVDLKR